MPLRGQHVIFSIIFVARSVQQLLVDVLVHDGQFYR